MSSVTSAENLLDLPAQVTQSENSAIFPFRGIKAIRWYARFFSDPLRCMIEARRDYGDIVVAGRVSRLQPRERQHFLAFGPECNRQVLGDTEVFHTTATGWPGPRDSALRRVRNGLTRMNGEKYQQQRRLLLPTFTKNAVEGYVGDMIAVMGEVLREHWRSGETVDIYRHMRTTALRLSSQILFGRLPPKESHDLSELLQNLMTRTFSAGVWMCPFDLPLTAYRRMRRNAEQLESMLRTLIARRRAAPSQHTDLLTTLVTAFDEQSVPMEDGDLIGQAKILFVASFENVACVLTWTAFLLAQHPQVMEELHAELGAVLGGKPPTVDQVEKLPLLDAVVKESMRVLSPVPFLVRKVTQPTVLSGLPVNVGDRVVCSAYMTHHQADLYPQPQRFLPDRWFQIKPTPYEYLPFGAGPRACIGRMFAMREIKVALAMILQRHRLTVEPGARIDRRMLVMMSPKHGLPMSIHDQDGRFHAVPVRGNIHEMVDLGEHAA